MHELQVGEVVHVDLELQDHNYAVASQANGTDVTAESELAYAPGLIVVPNHDLLR